MTGPIHDRIRTGRENRGLSQQELADELEIHNTTVSHWETGYRCPELSQLPALAEAIKVPFDVLLEDLMKREVAA
jgi:transcriptional regulator with XRE-family HTH domain